MKHATAAECRRLAAVLASKARGAVKLGDCRKARDILSVIESQPALSRALRRGTLGRLKRAAKGRTCRR